MELKKNGKTVRFDIKLKMQRDIIYARYIQRHNEVSAFTTNQGKVMFIAKVHDLLEHVSEEATRKTMQVLGWVSM